MYKSVTHGLLKDMDKTTLLSMREQGMSNREIADAVACSVPTIRKLIGNQPAEMTLANRAARVSRGGNGVRKMKSFVPGNASEQEEPAPAVLAVKPLPVYLVGKCMDYMISEDGVEVFIKSKATDSMIVIVNAESLGDLIAELTAIKKNIGAQQPMQFWG